MGDVKLQVQHLKSTDMGERYLLKGTQPGKEREQEGGRRQAEQDKLQMKTFENTIHRLEEEIGQLDNEGSKSILKQDGDVVKYSVSQSPGLPDLYSQIPATASGDKRLLKNSAACTMDTSVGKGQDRKTGDANTLSVSAGNPEELDQRGVKVYDNVQRVVFEVRSGGTATLENGLHPWSSPEADEPLKHVGQSYGDGAGVTVTHTNPGAVGVREQTNGPKEAKPETAVKERIGCEDRGAESTEASAAMPIAMVFVGGEEPRVLGLHGTVQADIVLIDEDDDRSLREKTVTDVSTADGNAADLVAGRPQSVSSELSSEDKEESSNVELPPPVTQKKKRCRCCTVM